MDSFITIYQYNFLKIVVLIYIARWSSWKLVGLIIQRSIVRVYPSHPLIPSARVLLMYKCGIRDIALTRSHGIEWSNWRLTKQT